MLSDETRRQSAMRLGNKLFIPALTIPVVTVIVTLGASHVVFGGTPLIELKNVTLIGFGIGCVIALGIACVMTRDTVGQSMKETRRLIDALSWAAVLPQMLGMLGLVFSDAGVGKAVAHVTTAYVNLDYRLVAVAVYCVGMALFTMVMGNGFAAFPVMTGGVGVPILVGVFHGNPATMVAIGMFSGYCGTLMTPMAANFNIVPAALLELPDKNAVIKVQVPTALVAAGGEYFVAELVDVFVISVATPASAGRCSSSARVTSRVRAAARIASPIPRAPIDATARAGTGWSSRSRSAREPTWRWQP